MRQGQYLGHMVTKGDRRTFVMAIERAKRLAEKDDAQPVLWTHEGADPDGIGAMKFVRDYLSQKHGLTARIITGPIMFTARPFAERLGVDISEKEDNFQSAGMHMVLDTCAKPLLNGARGVLVPERTLVIDHHVPDVTSIEAAYMIRNAVAISTCEMLASIVPVREITREGAFALAVGIASDTDRLRVAERRTIAIFERLLRMANVKRTEIDELADPSWDPKITRMVGSDLNYANWQTYEVGSKEWVIAIGQTSLEAPFILANALRRLNADISASFTEIGIEKFKISIRVGFAQANKTGVHANDIARRISQLCELPQEQWGGGEIDRAGVVIPGTPTQVVVMINAAIKDIIHLATKT
ncbi:Uncharacterised protein [Candidatus Bilamarchaeum dharawalense]|uniref:DDH domain-containing protein n=1 Tax=Candidatus Bilamarchaeum dharawalense TaxID=2885759 RepID=A0A5E4LQM0_9ARCH|nr:Uncharacterised protein [Candidatus Bilamarchaeum dharawalense]